MCRDIAQDSNGRSRLKVTTKGWVAVPAMMNLAMHGAIPMTCGEISKIHKVSESYLEIIFRKLRRSGLVTSVSGPRGGHCLAKDMAEISLADIIASVDSRERARPVKRRRGEFHVAHELWSKLDQKMFDYLRGVTLKQLVEEHRARQSSGSLRHSEASVR
jgi:Rrf2 family iron-sulfur cluster assembly transcriptional regulator